MARVKKFGFGGINWGNINRSTPQQAQAPSKPMGNGMVSTPTPGPIVAGPSGTPPKIFGFPAVGTLPTGQGLGSASPDQISRLTGILQGSPAGVQAQQRQATPAELQQMRLNPPPQISPEQQQAMDAQRRQTMDQLRLYQAGLGAPAPAPAPSKPSGFGGVNWGNVSQALGNMGNTSVSQPQVAQTGLGLVSGGAGPAFAQQMGAMGGVGTGLQQQFGGAGSLAGLPSAFRDPMKPMPAGMKKGGAVKKKPKKMASGGKVSSASKRADGCAIKGKTRGKMM